jgi:ABC-type glutathione transport system ATPase component
LSTIHRADKIIVLHHGEIREQGSHQDLLGLQGLYWRLYKLQYSDPNWPMQSKKEDEEEQPLYRPPARRLQFNE